MIVHLIDGRVKGFASRGSLARKTNGCSTFTSCIPRKTMGFYIGFSTDLKRRLAEHTRGAAFATKSRGPWKLIYYEAYTEREDAEGREKFLKSGAGRRLSRSCPLSQASLAANHQVDTPERSIPARSITSLSPRKRLPYAAQIRMSPLTD